MKNASSSRFMALEDFMQILSRILGVPKSSLNKMMLQGTAWPSRARAIHPGNRRSSRRTKRS
jgi:hypothetical protein